MQHQIGYKAIGSFAGHSHIHSTGEQICLNCGLSLQEIIEKKILECSGITKKELMKCPKCGKRLKAVIDKKTGKKSKYEFGCSCSPKIRVCIG